MFSTSPKLRVFAAALQHETFTTEELATAADVGVNTVRTVLRRYSDLFERVGDRRATGRRGGSFVQYRLEPKQSRRLRKEVGALVDLPNARFEPDPEDRLGVAEVLDALDLLDRRFAIATDRQHILTLARLSIGGLRQQYRGTSGALDAVVRLLDGALALRTLEIAEPSCSDANTTVVRAMIAAILPVLGLRGAARETPAPPDNIVDRASSGTSAGPGVPTPAHGVGTTATAFVDTAFPVAPDSGFRAADALLRGFLFDSDVN